MGGGFVGSGGAPMSMGMGMGSLAGLSGPGSLAALGSAAGSLGLQSQHMTVSI
jgi:hypothetical protein